MADIRFVKGSSAAYQAITPDAYTFYFINNTDLYLGSIKLTNGNDLNKALVRIAENEEQIEAIKKMLKDGDFINQEQIQQMINNSLTTVSNKIETLEGAVEEQGTQLAAVAEKVEAYEEIAEKVETLESTIEKIEEEGAALYWKPIIE